MILKLSSIALFGLATEVGVDFSDNAISNWIRSTQYIKMITQHRSLVLKKQFT